MFLAIYHNQSGMEFIRRLSPSESLDLRAHVNKWVETEFEGEATPSFSEVGSHIPGGCGEYQAEIRDTKAESGSCWASEPFFILYGEESI
jgi:hypothetical protein